MTPDRADGHANFAAAYVHIPFCSAVCPYCDFAVVADRDDLAGRYVDALSSEIRDSPVWRPLDAIYFGGGTPSHVDPTLLIRILDSLGSKHGISNGAEITLEANPEDFTPERAATLRRAGFNRVSFGAQSLDDTVLIRLGRRHDRLHIERSVESARQAGFDNLNLDLIYGEPTESRESWRQTLEAALALEPDHLSCYALTVEPGTALGREVRAGAAAPDPDEQADRYELADALAMASGYQRYEVSNWSRGSKECRYNLTVWAQGEYEAYGNGAHGYRDGVRFRNHRRLDAYIDRIESGKSPRAGQEQISGWDSELDRMFVGLRRTVGVSLGPGTMALMNSADGRSLLEAGVIVEENGRVMVRRPLLTDAVHRSVLALSAPNVMLEINA